MYVSDTIVSASGLLKDYDLITTTFDELFSWYNAGQRAIVGVVPEANSVEESIALVEGSRQYIPSNGICLIDVTGNTGDGKPITIIDREVLDVIRPGWKAESNVSVIEHYMFDGRYPKAFEVYPPAIAGTEIDVLFAGIPADATIKENKGSLGDEYSDALLEYIMFRALSKDMVNPKYAEMAVAYQQAFLSRLGAEVQSEVVVNPNKNAPPYDPAKAGVK